MFVTLHDRLLLAAGVCCLLGAVAMASVGGVAPRGSPIPEEKLALFRGASMQLLHPIYCDQLTVNCWSPCLPYSGVKQGLYCPEYNICVKCSISTMYAGGHLIPGYKYAPLSCTPSGDPPPPFDWNVGYCTGAGDCNFPNQPTAYCGGTLNYAGAPE